MRRREFITLLDGAAAWPLAARAQQPRVPVVGFLDAGSAAERGPQVAAFRKGLAEGGYQEGQNVALEFRWAEGQYGRFGSDARSRGCHRPRHRRGVHEHGAREGRRSITRRVQLAILAAHHTLPTIYPVRAYPEAGGLISYGTDILDAFRQVGVYTARVLKVAKPADLPVLQSTKFEFVINLQTARALGLENLDNDWKLTSEEIDAFVRRNPQAE